MTRREKESCQTPTSAHGQEDLGALTFLSLFQGLHKLQV